MFSNLEFFIIEAFRSFRRSALMSFVAIGIIAVTLVIFGMFILLVINLGNIIGNVSSRMDVAAYVEKDISLESAGALQIKLTNLPGVEKVNFISRTEAWRKFREDFGGKLNLDEVMTSNPLPHTYTIKVKTPEYVPILAKRLSKFDEITEIRYSGQLIDQIKTLMDAVRLGGSVLIILISFATLLIVVNTIRLTVLARETEIYIMKLVGATNSFVKWPFIIEGVMIGVVGGGLSFLALKFSYDAVFLRISTALPFLPLVSDQRLLTMVYLVMIFGGTALGMIGAYVSVSKVLKAEI
ncbi:MAG: permease-like cell division protein FtsX [Candidatus Margulisiibacteriota bacterium]|nr:permease-like cell division protein FtsX [Candidatus Margulisiibacteriota bacterium]